MWAESMVCAVDISFRDLGLVAIGCAPTTNPPPVSWVGGDDEHVWPKIKGGCAGNLRLQPGVLLDRFALASGVRVQAMSRFLSLVQALRFASE